MLTVAAGRGKGASRFNVSTRDHQAGPAGSDGGEIQGDDGATLLHGDFATRVRVSALPICAKRERGERKREEKKKKKKRKK